MSGCDGMKTTRVVILSEHSERRIPRNLRREVEFAWALGRAPRSQVLKCVVGNPEFDDGTYRDESSEEVPHRGTIAAPRIPKLYLLLRQGSMLFQPRCVVVFSGTLAGTVALSSYPS